ncbi:MAG: hypothetical protein M1308_16255 [Actinobacteria bacterium]|nr:hypothetical protein [Actinomycetota bacterium]
MVVENPAELLYCRQFLLSPKKIDSFPFPDWICTNVSNSFHIYSHPYLSVTQVQDESTRLTLIGYMLDPYKPDKSNKEILEDLLDDATAGKDILVSQDTLGGRYIIIMSTKNDMILFNDACGLRQIYYFIDKENQIWGCSQPDLLSEITDLELDKSVINDFVKKIFYNQKEYFWPGSLSQFSEVKKLLPNHFLSLKKCEVFRFFPREPLVETELNEGVHKASILLKKLMKSAEARFQLALPLTAGLDSRTILAACREFKEKIFYYTLFYPPNKLKSPDLVIPMKILDELGLEHNMIDCTNPMDEWFADIYKKNVSYAHSYWGGIAFGMYGRYPEGRVCIKGNCSEIARCFYYKEGNYNPKRIKGAYLSNLEWGKNYISIEVINEWLKNIRKLEKDFNFNLLGLFYWEHRMGNWQAMSQLEWDLVQESFTPFNNRALLSILLSVNYKHRVEPDYRLYKEIINNLWPELLNYPINPPIHKNFVFFTLKKILKKIKSLKNI